MIRRGGVTLIEILVLSVLLSVLAVVVPHLAWHGGAPAARAAAVQARGSIGSVPAR